MYVAATNFRSLHNRRSRGVGEIKTLHLSGMVGFDLED